MSAYTVERGDTFERISRRVYGTDAHAASIRSANPDVPGVLTPGQVIEVPNLDNLLSVAPVHATKTSESEVTVSVAGKTFRFWDSVRLTQAIDKPATVSLGAPFEPDNAAFREVFSPLSYRPVTVSVAGSRLFTGVTVTPNPSLSADGRTATVDAYARCATLGDCTMPASAYPVEFNGLDVRDIAIALGRPFGITAILTADPGAAFERVALDPEKKILNFLIGLCKQRIIVISSDVQGMLVLQDETGEEPVAFLEESPLVTVSAEFKPQEFYSSITCISPSLLAKAGQQFTVKNPHMKGVLRPWVFKGSDTLESDVAVACKAKAARMYAGAATFSIVLPGWHDPNGKLWKPNTRVRLRATGAMIYRASDFLIREVINNQSKDTTSSVLNLVLLGSYGGTIPKTLPWDTEESA